MSLLCLSWRGYVAGLACSVVVVGEIDAEGFRSAAYFYTEQEWKKEVCK